MTREAQRLRDEGWTLQRIADHFGVSISTVKRWTDPEYAERERQAARDWKRRNPDAVRRQGFRPCQSCGAPRSRQSVSGKCRKCWREDHQKADAQIVALWNSGASGREIAATVGLALGTVRIRVVQLREAGHDLPYRYGLQNPKHPALLNGEQIKGAILSTTVSPAVAEEIRKRAQASNRTVSAEIRNALDEYLGAA